MSVMSDKGRGTPQLSGELTVEATIDLISGPGISFKHILLWTGLMSFMAAASFGSFFPSFGGYIPYDAFQCVSPRCFTRLSSQAAEFADFFDKDKVEKLICDEDGSTPFLKVGSDFAWQTNRSTFGMEWELTCGRYKLTALSGSLSYAGHILGSFSGNLFDVFGRRRGALAGLAVLLVVNCIIIGSTSIIMFMIMRVIWGIALMTAMDGIFVFMMEHTASNHRTITNGGYQLFWALGYIFVTTCAYLIESWRWLQVVNCVMLVIPIISVLILPESPYYAFVTLKQEDQAKESLRWLARLHGTEQSTLDSVKLIVEDEETGGKEKVPFFESLKDFIKYKEMLLQTGIQVYLWFVVGITYYGFTFVWSEISSNFYLSYLLPGIAEAFIYTTMVIPLKYIGRRPTLAAFFLTAGIAFLVSLVNIDIPGFLSVEYLACLIGSIGVSGGFGSVYMYSVELAPTAHRGKILGTCHFGSQVGAVLGPLSTVFLVDKWNREGVMIVFAVLCLVGGFLILRLPETKDRPVPNTAAEVKRVRQVKNPERASTV